MPLLSRPACAISAARSTARALFWVSCHSVCGHRVGDDAGAGLHIQRAVLDHRGADGDGQVHVAVEAEITDRAGIDAALGRLQFVDDFHGPHLGRAAHRAGRESRLQHRDRIQPGLQLAFDVGDDVHHMRIALDDHVLGDLHAADLATRPDIVAAEVHQHHVLGALLGIGEQFLLRARHPPRGSRRAGGCRQSAARSPCRLPAAPGSRARRRPRGNPPMSK